MALNYTFSEQHRPLPSSGNALTEDGSGLHSRLGIDMMLSANNLAYSMPFVGFAAPYVVYGETWDSFKIGTLNYSQNIAASSTEYFASQLPTVLPASAGRLCWTLGLYVINQTDGENTTSLDKVTVYLSPQPYIGNTGLAFSAASMGSPYGTSSVTVNQSFVAGDPTAYVLVDNSAGTTQPIIPFDNKTSGGLASVHLIVTTTAHRTSGAATGTLTIFASEFTWWVLPV